MRFGPLQLKSNLFLSPLAGYTNLPFRLVLREVGGLGLTTTDLVNARSLLERNPKALKLIETNEADSPLAVQLFGAVPEEMRDAIAKRHRAQLEAVAAEREARAGEAATLAVEVREADEARQTAEVTPPPREDRRGIGRMGRMGRMVACCP